MHPYNLSNMRVTWWLFYFVLREKPNAYILVNLTHPGFNGHSILFQIYFKDLLLIGGTSGHRMFISVVKLMLIGVYVGADMYIHNPRRVLFTFIYYC